MSSTAYRSEPDRLRQPGLARRWPVDIDHCRAATSSDDEVALARLHPTLRGISTSRERALGGTRHDGGAEIVDGVSGRALRKWLEKRTGRFCAAAYLLT